VPGNSGIGKEHREERENEGERMRKRERRDRRKEEWIKEEKWTRYNTATSLFTFPALTCTRLVRRDVNCMTSC